MRGWWKGLKLSEQANQAHSPQTPALSVNCFFLWEGEGEGRGGKGRGKEG